MKIVVDEMPICPAECLLSVNEGHRYTCIIGCDCELVECNVCSMLEERKNKIMDGDAFSKLLDKMPFSDKMFDVAADATKQLFDNVCKEYNCTFEDFREMAREKLRSTNMNMGCCFLAWNFCKDCDDLGGKNYETKEKLISEMILAAAIYYENCAGKDCL